MAAVFDAAPEGARPKMRAARYVLRYLVITALVAIAYKLNLVSLAATLAGMCVFVPAAYPLTSIATMIRAGEAIPSIKRRNAMAAAARVSPPPRVPAPRPAPPPG